MPVIIFIKGVGAGLCAGYLFSVYSFQGAVFYVIVMLPGLFLSSLSLLLQSKRSYGFSRELWLLFSPRKKYSEAQKPDIFNFLQKSGGILIITAAAAVTDVLFTAFFSQMFTFA